MTPISLAGTILTGAGLSALVLSAGMALAFGEVSAEQRAALEGDGAEAAEESAATEDGAAAGEATEVAAADGELTIFSGVYTDEQADAGEALFMGECSACHGNAARGGTAGPGLVGFAFDSKHAGEPLWVYFDFMHTNMPPSDPGWFTDEEYAAITAHILRLHGAPSGDTPLPSDEAGLTAIAVVPTP